MCRCCRPLQCNSSTDCVMVDCVWWWIVGLTQPKGAKGGQIQIKLLGWPHRKKPVIIMVRISELVGLNNVSYWVTSLELECTFSGQGWKRSAYVGCNFLVEFLAWENSSQKVSNLVLTLLPNGGLKGITPSPHPPVTGFSPKKIHPSTVNIALLCFLAISPLKNPLLMNYLNFWTATTFLKLTTPSDASWKRHLASLFSCFLTVYPPENDQCVHSLKHTWTKVMTLILS